MSGNVTTPGDYESNRQELCELLKITLDAYEEGLYTLEEMQYKYNAIENILIALDKEHDNET
jgi:hypothetical protein